METAKETVWAGDRAFEGFTVKTNRSVILLIRARRGFLGCGYFSREAADRVGDCCAIVRGVSTYQDMLDARIADASTKAQELGVRVGMTGKESLMLMEVDKMKLLHDKDADIGILEGKKVAVIGYGAQGRAQSLCMKDSGVDVIVGVRKGGASWEKAKKEGLSVASIADASEQADIIHILLPDEVQEGVYNKDIKPHIVGGKTLSWSHGFNLCFKRIVPPKDVDLIMFAPKAPGTEERKRFVEGFGVPGLVAVRQDVSGKARDVALALAKACGLTRAGVLECTFEQETYEDLFGEQAVLCGGTAELIKAGFETLTEAGYPPEMAYFECLHELKLIVDLIYEGGLAHMWDVVSNTAEYGGRTRGRKIITDETRRAMKDMLRDVESGKFAEEWMDEYRKGLPVLKKLREEEASHPIEKVGKEIRGLFEKR
ncbi:MAG: ketol-acid reductoisomerase [archaeon]